MLRNAWVRETWVLAQNIKENLSFQGSLALLCLAPGRPLQLMKYKAWDTDGSVRRAGRLAGSVTLIQGLAADTELASKAAVLNRTMKGLAILGRGLMEGHSVVVARVNSTLAAAAAASARPQPQPSAPVSARGPAADGGPPAKKARK